LSHLHLKMQQDIGTLKQSAMLRWSRYVLANFGEVGSTHPQEQCQLRPTPQNCTAKHAISSTTRRWIIRFRSNFVQSLNAWHAKCPKSSRLRSHHYITAKIRKIINNSADCSISLKFRTDFDHVMIDVLRTLNFQRVNGQSHRVT